MKYLIVFGLLMSNVCFSHPKMCLPLSQLPGGTSCKQHCESYGNYKETSEMCCCIPSGAL